MSRALIAVSLLGVTIVAGCGDGSPPSQNPTNHNAHSRDVSDLSTLPYRQRSIEFTRRCMDADGWASTVSSGGGLEFTVPPEQKSAFRVSQEKCAGQFIKEYPPKTLTVKDYKSLYQQELRAAACLAKLGYPQRSTPISEQQYVDAYERGDRPAWMAYDAFTGNDVAVVERQCPQPSVD